MTALQRRVLTYAVGGMISAVLFVLFGNVVAGILGWAQGGVAWGAYIFVSGLKGLLGGAGFGFAYLEKPPGRHLSFWRGWMATASTILYYSTVPVSQRRESTPLIASLLLSVVMAFLVVAIYRGVSWVIDPQQSPTQKEGA